MEHLSLFDEYPVENFHSLSRAQTPDADTAELLRKKAKALDGHKSASASFTSVYAVPKEYTFSRDRLDTLKQKAASFLLTVLHAIKEKPHQARQVARPPQKPKNLSYWKLPSIYGEENIMPSKILPLGFHFLGKEANPQKSVQ